MQKKTNADSQLTTEVLCEQNHMPLAVFKGLMAYKNWKPGKVVSPEEFHEAEQQFMSGRIDGRKGEKPC